MLFSVVNSYITQYTPVLNRVKNVNHVYYVHGRPLDKIKNIEDVLCSSSIFLILSNGHWTSIVFNKFNLPI